MSKDILQEGADLNTATVTQVFNTSRQDIADLFAEDKITADVRDWAIAQVNGVEAILISAGADAIDANAVDAGLARASLRLQAIVDGRDAARKDSPLGRSYVAGRARSLELNDHLREAHQDDAEDEGEDYFSEDLTSDEPLSSETLTPAELADALGIDSDATFINEDSRRDN